MTVSLRELLADPDVPDVMISGLCEDSRAVQSGDAFIAIQGELSDGHDFVEQAQTCGAVAILCERGVDTARIPAIVVADLKARRGALAARLYADPSRQLKCVGVTGTNGKTTIAHYIADIAGRIGHSAGYMGTIGWGVPGALEDARLTTEDAVTVQRRLRKLVDAGHTWVAMEVSSHALIQGRVADVAFDVAVFSNLSRDHLDYHVTQEAYGRAKAALFSYPSLTTAVVNMDDPLGRRIASELRPDVRLIGYGHDADISWRNLTYTAHGVRGRWRTPWGDTELKLPVAGEFSVANMAAAVGVLCGAGLALEAVLEAAASATAVPGRMEFFHAKGQPTVVVDFAHTPDALDKMLEALRRHTSGRLVCVFGCGGDRDSGKRPLMAEAAERCADVLWLTSDNPRSEDPEQILDAIAAGLSGNACTHRCADRGEAIARALGGASVEDLVVVAGKGHENYQETGGVRVDYSDRDTVTKLLAVTG